MGTTRGVNVHVAASRRGDMNFLARVRELAGDKPVGFKLCVGSRRGFLAVCKALREADLTPDFIRPAPPTCRSGWWIRPPSARTPNRTSGPPPGN
ncbi:hypothetical protein ACFWNR_37820 [Streptomyces virginiae]|uniref:hypothetical protein n=1 Tax=Streptomyces virginiae TaxID=1961 RepID=UPI00099DD890